MFAGPLVLSGGLPVTRFADVAEMLTQHDPTVGQVVGHPTIATTGVDAPAIAVDRDSSWVPVSMTWRASNSSTLCHPVPTTQDDGRRHTFDDVPDEPAGHHALVEGVQGGLHGAATVVPEHDDQRNPQHADRVFDGAEHRSVDDVAGGADHEHVTEALVEDDPAATWLSAQPKTTAVGRCATARLARCSMLWLGARGGPRRTARYPPLPSTLLQGWYSAWPHCASNAPTPPGGTPMSIAADELVGWYRLAARPSPAKPQVSAWQILVSEFMLQQTPVARVEPIWVDWVARWPTPSATAAAGAADVLRAWGNWDTHVAPNGCTSALRRSPPSTQMSYPMTSTPCWTARNRRVHRPGGGLFRLRPTGTVVDTNVRRVVARAVHGRADAGRPSPARDHADVESLLPHDDTAAVFSAALMELGATVCTARSPKCGLCP